MTSAREFAEIYAPDGMSMFPVYSADGGMTGEIAMYEIISRHEKETRDQSQAKWFPQIITRQKVLIQEWWGADPDHLAKHGEPRMEWVLVPEESEVLPFVSTISK